MERLIAEFRRRWLDAFDKEWGVTAVNNETRDRVFFRYVNDIKDIWRDGYGNEVGSYFESLGHWYRLVETRIEEECGMFLFTALFRYKGTQAEPGVEPQPTGSDLGEFVQSLKLAEFAEDSRWMRANRIRMAGETLVYPINSATSTPSRDEVK